MHWDAEFSRVIEHSKPESAVDDEVRWREFVADDPHFLNDKSTVASRAGTSMQADSDSGASRCTRKCVRTGRATVQPDIGDDRYAFGLHSCSEKLIAVGVEDLLGIWHVSIQGEVGADDSSEAAQSPDPLFGSFPNLLEPVVVFVEVNPRRGSGHREASGLGECDE